MASTLTPPDSDAWLAKICEFEPLAMTPVAQSEDLFKEETRQYLHFEGGRGELQDPLAWWKVHNWLFVTQLTEVSFFDRNTVLPSQPSCAWLETFS